MRNKTSTWIFFFLFVLTASGVFAAMVENSRQGLPAISVTSHPAFSLESSEQRQGLSRILLNLVSGGAFTSKDPIGFNGGMNLYRYADNNPIIYTDPMGNSSCYKDLVVRVLNYFMDYNSPFVYSKATFSTAFSFFHQMENGPNISILDYSLKNTTHVTLGTTLIRKWTPETLAVFSSFDVPDTANEKIVNLVISDTNWRKDSRAGLSDTAVRSALIDGNYSDHSDPMKLGWTLAHETGHLLGLPDWFYRGELMMPANWPAMEFMEAHQDKILDSLAK